MRRPWLSSGEGERIGVVIWPPHLFSLRSEDIQGDVVRDLVPGRSAVNLTTLPSDGSTIQELQDADLGPGGPWVTRWGADPIRPGYPVPMSVTVRTIIRCACSAPNRFCRRTVLVYLPAGASGWPSTHSGNRMQQGGLDAVRRTSS